MNIELLTEIRDWLAAGAPTYKDFDFDMSIFIEVETTEDGWCGSACCIAGAALIFGDLECVEVTLDNMSSSYGRSGEIIWWQENVSELAAELLGLNPEQAEALFCPWSHHLDDPLPDTLPPSLAAKVIDNLIETGQVNWII